ncbi:MAG: ribosome silencing factor [Deltaproteobacteria bacterium]|nr:ribosome silencing factor [Deltaproteobacteria bacterium]
MVRRPQQSDPDDGASERRPRRHGGERKESRLEIPDPKTKARWIVEAALDRKAERPVALDMRSLTSYADSFILLTGRSDRQVRSISDAVVDVLKQQGEPPLGVEGESDGNWVLIDCNDAIVHVFDPETREQYDLERLWRDAPRIDLEIEGVDPNPSLVDEIDVDGEADEDGAFPAA